MQKTLSIEERSLLTLLKHALSADTDQLLPNLSIDNKQWEKVVDIAQKHAVLPLLYDTLVEYAEFPVQIFDKVEQVSRQVVQQNYRLLFQTRNIVRLFEDNNITVIILKGIGTAALYPIWELRKSGDVDLLVTDEDEFLKACKILEDTGYVRGVIQHANHHETFQSKEQIEIELHSMLAEPFDHRKVNDYIQKVVCECGKHVQRISLMGTEIPIADEAYNAFSLLLHMLQHFLRAGFGLKLLCDWVAFWNREVEVDQKKLYLQLIRESGLSGFSQVVTKTCVQYLGLRKENIEFMLEEELEEAMLAEFIAEIMEAEEFGNSTGNRMVMMRGTSVLDYIREFHHQMRLNYAKCSKILIFWPILWVMTFIVFFVNNRKIRKISSIDILKKTQARSKIMTKIKLFK